MSESRTFVLRSLNIPASVLASTAGILHQKDEERDGSGEAVKDDNRVHTPTNKAGCVLSGRPGGRVKDKGGFTHWGQEVAPHHNLPA